MRLFADDSSICSIVKNVNIAQQILSNNLITITNWAYQWKIKFNADITMQAVKVIFSTKYNKDNHPNLTFNDISVAQQDVTGHLGVILDEKLTFVNIPKK